mmetsp:Transcript_10714/g.27070  ORF Transcript_10714/g.27070 Transcript_10714/m.27070 type:complete len:303 (-) Transcript_10714:420-1328(-)
MKSVNPYQISLVEALNNHLGKLAVDIVVGSPEFLFPATAAVDGSLFDVIPAKLGELFFVVASVLIGGIGIVLGGMGSVHRCHVVQDGPQNALAESIVHFSKDQRINPNRNTIEGPQTLFDQVSLFNGYSVVFRLSLLFFRSILGSTIIVVAAAVVGNCGCDPFRKTSIVASVVFRCLLLLGFAFLLLWGENRWLQRGCFALDKSFVRNRSVCTLSFEMGRSNRTILDDLKTHPGFPIASSNNENITLAKHDRRLLVFLGFCCCFRRRLFGVIAFRTGNRYQMRILPHNVCFSLGVDLNHNLG